MSSTNVSLLKTIPADELKNYVDKIVFRTFYSLKATADEFPVKQRTADDYDFVQQYIKIIAVQGDTYESLSVNPTNYLVSTDQKIENYKFFIPNKEGRNSFVKDLRNIKKKIQKEHDETMRFLDNALVIG